MNRIAGIEMEWLKESLSTLQKTNPKEWSNATVIEKIVKITGKPAGKVSEAVSYLNPKQAIDFCKDIQDNLDKLK